MNPFQPGHNLTCCVPHCLLRLAAVALDTLENNAFPTAPPGFTVRLAVLLSFQGLVVICDLVYLWLLHHIQRTGSSRGVDSAGPGVWWVARWVDRPKGRIMVVNQRVMSTIFSVLAQVVWIAFNITNLKIFTGGTHSLSQSIVWRGISVLSLLGWFWVLTWGNITSYIIAADPKIDSRIINAVLIGLGGGQLAASIITAAFLIVRGNAFNRVLRSLQSDLRSKAAAYPNVPAGALAEVFTKVSIVKSTVTSYYYMFYILGIITAVVVSLALVFNFGGLMLARKIERQIVFNENNHTSYISARQASVQPHQGSTISDPGRGGGAGSQTAHDLIHSNEANPSSKERDALAGFRRAKNDILTMFGMVLCFAIIVMAPLLFNLIMYRTTNFADVSWAKTEVLFTCAPWVVTAVMLVAQVALIWIAVDFHSQGGRAMVHSNVAGSSATDPIDVVMLERGARNTLEFNPRANSTGARRATREDPRSQTGSGAIHGSKIFVDVDVEVDSPKYDFFFLIIITGAHKLQFFGLAGTARKRAKRGYKATTASNWVKVKPLRAKSAAQIKTRRAPNADSNGR
ncbi:BZ3500_MvSof-1268-A1-R1_Chr10-1g02639 [Microbotryum saponariae]|uniref:BZ3500_MvSof-1268-A1-R1_Chr10-1g02639 protein n=1 Tax=Microbotryum saponariae TaxID=289078 RepID=A0A2X0LLS1_9BASI|nr:BZ3500_MvSof-1268-A1-R1_Chr10-1g02639 [Microbotryum saponariae]SDA06128.1 BZ3501_MvSof-1269-A2-R1_Chr10-1g02240 [Microbotryum saponariae]